MEKEYNKYLWSPKQPRVYGISPLTISGTPMPEEDVATSLKVENSQQRFQQNPVVKRSEQWEAQQKQREEEIAASKKWLELHPEDESDSPYTILERGKHQAIVDGKDPSYYEKMIDDGKQFTKGALSVLSLPYLSAAAAGVYGYGASLGARGLFAAQGIHGLANENGVRKTANLIKSGDYGRAALSGAGDALNAAMVLPGAKLLGNAAKFLGSTAKYGLKSTVAGNMLSKNVRYNAPNMETVADYTNKQIFDNLMKYPNKEYNDIPVYTDLNTMKIKKVKNPELVKFEFSPSNFGESVQLEKAVDEFGNNVFLRSFDPSQGRYVDKTFLNGDQKFIHYRATEGYDGKTLFPKADNKVDPVGHIWFNANSSAHSLPDKYKLEHFAIDPIPSTGHPWSESFRLVSDPVDVSNAIHTKYNPITLGLETQIKPFTPPKNSTIGKTSYAFFERPSKLSEAELKGIPKSVRNQPDNTALPTRGFDVIPTNKNNFYRVSGPSEITDISEFGKLRIDPIARFDQMQLRIINEQTGIPMERLYEINASDNPRAIQNLVMESEAYKSASPFDQFNMKLSAARPKSNHGDKGFQRGAFFSIYDPNNPASKYYGAPTIVGTTRKSSFLGGHHGDYRGEWNLDIPVGSGQNSGSAVLRNGFEKENFKYWKLGNDGKWYLHNFKQGGILKRVESGKSGIHIKPENRGKFTALKKRTGKSSTWYKEHGTPAQKKMAVFALNARKWKHK